MSPSKYTKVRKAVCLCLPVSLLLMLALSTPTLSHADGGFKALAANQHLREPLAWHGAFAHGNYLYVLGGYFPETGISQEEYWSDEIYRAQITVDGSLLVPAGETNAWTPLSEAEGLPLNIACRALVKTPKRVYLIGGYVPDSSTDYRSDAVIYIDLKDDGSLGTPIELEGAYRYPRKANHIAATYYQGSIYAVGGLTAGGSNPTYTKSVHRAKLNEQGELIQDASGTVWQPLGNYPFNVQGGALTFSGNTPLYIGGETSKDDNRVIRNQVIKGRFEDGGSISWNDDAYSLPVFDVFPEPRVYFSFLKARRSVYIFGGWDSNKISRNSLYTKKLNPDGSWNPSPDFTVDENPSPDFTVDEMPQALDSLATVHSQALGGDYIYIIGGRSGSELDAGAYHKEVYVSAVVPNGVACENPADCISGFCNAAQVCGPRLAGQGAGCSDANACESGQCVDGVCCNSACGNGANDCQVCNRADSLGTCTTIANPTQSVCRTAQSLCDVPESCVAGSLLCPEDVKREAGDACGTEQGSSCNAQLQCIADDGSTVPEPTPDVIDPNGTELPKNNNMSTEETGDVRGSGCSLVQGGQPTDTTTPAAGIVAVFALLGLMLVRRRNIRE